MWRRLLWWLRVNLRSVSEVRIDMDESPIEPAGVSTPMSVHCPECGKVVTAQLRAAHETGDLIQCDVDASHWWVRPASER